jgi:hypothetical protein
MRKFEFENHDEAPWVLLIEPWGHQHQVPDLGRADVRYSLRPGEEDRCYSAVLARQIELWINAGSYEIDIVPPAPFRMLMWDICVRGGWCGGIADGAPTHVSDLLPASGPVTAETFAKLTVQADGSPSSEPPRHHHLQWLEAKFVKHLGSSLVDAKLLRQAPRRPFDSDDN